MEVRIDSLLAGAKRAEGVVVIIDVYRAFTTACVAFERGAERVILTAEIDDASLLKRQGAGTHTVGEVGGKRPEDFDFGNSPYEVSRFDFSGAVPILSTRAGTVGVNAAWHAESIYAASLMNASATVRAIRNREPGLVTLVPMGWQGRVRTDEDELCAIYLKNMLQGNPLDPGAIRTLVLGCTESQKFGDPEQPHFHPGDREWALRVDAVSFAVPVVRRDRMLVATREDVD